MSVLVHFALAPTTVLTPKWRRTGMGTNWESGLVIGDVTGDGQEDVVYSGGSSNTIYVLDGTDGSTIATYTNNRIGTYTQSQLYDVDGDGVLDILVPLYYEPGLAAVQYDGDGTLYEMWEIYSQADQAPGGSVGSGTVMAKPVAGDIDGDGDLDIFLASQDVSPGKNQSGIYTHDGYDGTIVRVDHEGNILYTTFTWRACSGGLSLGDTNDDGRLELYQGDRDMDYNDGGYGKGVKSYWADDLTERWIRLDDLTSSQAPVLADVNGDGIKDVIVGMYNEQYVLDSATGEVIYYWGDNDLSVHYGTTVYDIDGDGNLELLCEDGDHDEQPYTDVFDLVTGEMDAQLYHFGQLQNLDTNPANEFYEDWEGNSKWSPLVADIDPTHPGKEIISTPEGTGLDNGGYWHSAILIYSSSYESLQNVTRSVSDTRLISQLGFPVVQDIDGDGYLELVAHSSGGNIYAYATVAPAPGYNESELPGTKRIRSEVTYYGENRLGVAEHTIPPWGENYWTAPLVAPISPSDNALAVPVSTTQLSFQLREHQSESLTYSVTTSPNIGSASDFISSGTYNWNTINVPVSGLNYDTTYRWTVTASDGVNVTARTYTFRTELGPPGGNTPPSQGEPLLVSLDGLNATTSNFLCSNQSTTDGNGDEVTNLYRWIVDGDPVAKLLLPFDTKNETSTADYSGYGNDGVVDGAVWVPDGRVGGAYMFDGKDDSIIVSDGGLGYFNDVNYSSNNEELGGFGNWYGLTVEAWIYLTEYNNGSRIVAKIPSYALGFDSHRTSRLYAAVWPMTFEVADIDDNPNGNSLDRMRSTSMDVDVDLNTWYHIAFTYESGVGIKLYFNGELVSQSSAYEGPVKISRGEPLYIGRLVQPFAGMIDEVRISSYAQPDEQIYNRYMESKDGSSSNSTFNPSGAGGAMGDTLACEVIPTDSFEEGNVESASIILENAPPNASNLNIYPIRGRDFRLTTEDLDATYDYFDPDGDAESGTEIRWYRDGVLQPAFNDLTHVPAASTSDGQEWNFTVRPRDSVGDFGDLQAYTVTIRDNVAPGTGTPLLVSSGGGDEDDEDLIASAQGTSDGDGDAVTNIYHLIQEGTSWTNLQLPFDTETPLYLGSNGTTTDYSGYGNDGTVVGASWTEDGAVGGAFSFDGNDFIRVTESGNSLGGDGGWSAISVECWVKIEGTAYAIVMHDAEDERRSYRFRFRAGGGRDRFYWYVYNDTASENVYFADYDNVGVWHHVVGTYESSVGLNLYVDGLLRDSKPFSGDINATVDDFLDIGAGFSGLMDEVRIYPKALSAAQIFQRFIDTKYGLSDNSTIVYHETADGDDWECEVIPSDSWEDGSGQTSANLHVGPVIGNGRCRIDAYTPSDTVISMVETESITFLQTSSDYDDDNLTYSWELDSFEQSTASNWTYTPLLGDAGIYQVTLTISDGEYSDNQTWTVNVEQKTEGLSYLVVRGTDDCVWYRPSDGVSFGNWVGIGGLTLDTPAAAVFDGQLHVVVNGTDGALWWCSVNLTDDSFSGWQMISGQGTPSLATNSTHLYLVVRGTDDGVWYRSFNGVSWGDWGGLGGLTLDTPAAAVFDGQLHVVVNGTDGVLWWCNINLTDQSFSGWQAISGEGTPALATSGSGLQLVVRGTDDGVWYRSFEGVSWSNWTGLGGLTLDTPAAAVFDGQLHVVVNGTDGSLWWCSISQPWQGISGEGTPTFATDN